MKDIERQAYFRTGRRCPQGPDLGLSKSTRGGFKVLYSSFEKTKPFFSENDLQHIAQDICFPSFTTLHVEHLFAGMRPQVVRLQTCMLMTAADQAVMLNLHRTYITPPFHCIPDPKVNTQNKQEGA